MKNVGIYLNFNGKTEEAFNFYALALETKINFIMRFKDTPDGSKLTPEEQEKIMHISMPLINGILLMGTDTLASMGHTTTYGTTPSIYLDTNSEEETNKIFNKLGEGGTIEMKLEKTFWGSYFGSLKDKYGIEWMLNYTYPQS